LFKEILLNTDNGTATITLNRAASMNALTIDTFLELAEAFNACNADRRVRAILVRGDGKCFSSGGDIAMFSSALKETTSFERYKRDVLCCSEMTYAIRKCQKPTIAVVHGACFGAGMSLALSCDFRIIEPNTTMNTAFINVGFSGDTGTIFFLKEMLGLAKMTELMMLADTLQADDIMRLGLATKIVETKSLADESIAFASRLAKGPTAGFAHQKQLFWEYFFRDYELFAAREAEHMARCSETEDFREAVTAFLQKRKPDYKGL